MALSSLAAGAVAGAVADLALFPLDTLKTRLQAEQGFRQAGGFARLYSGLGPVMVGSAPSAALFFLVYDSSKAAMEGRLDTVTVALGAAGVGEVVASLVRVPVELVKQRRQAGAVSNTAVIADTWRSEGVRGFYRGSLATLGREVPFSLIQFPVWEWLKARVCMRRGGGGPVTPPESAGCGAVAGVVAGTLTTPLDVVKTRIMLTTGRQETGALALIQRILRTEGWTALFAGLLPRVLWIALGGTLFFGVYEQARLVFSREGNRRGWG